MPVNLYVSISGEDKILIYTVNPKTGSLEVQGEVALSGRPSGMTIDPIRQYIYVGRKGDKSLSTFRRNVKTGSLSLVGTAQVENEPDWVAMDRKGKFLFSTFFMEDTMDYFVQGITFRPDRPYE
jgi:6-phosphogluconolactonase